MDLSFRKTTVHPRGMKTLPKPRVQEVMNSYPGTTNVELRLEFLHPRQIGGFV